MIATDDAAAFRRCHDAALSLFLPLQLVMFCHAIIAAMMILIAD